MDYCFLPSIPCNGEVGYGTSKTMPVLNKVSPRVEIDTSPPFASVKEAVTHFEGTGFRPPFRPLRYSPAFAEVGEVDLKSAEEQALELEKNLIMKELETLDVLEELGTTKRIVEGLKWQLQKEALRCTATAPEAEEHNLRGSLGGNFSGDAQCRMQSQELILMELNQARSNLGKTIGELGVIQTSVESLNKRIKREKEILEKTRLRLTSKTSEVMVLPLKPQPCHDEATTYDQSKCTSGINASEMKLVAARKMEAARAAEAVSMAEIKAFSRNEASFNIYLPEHDNLIPFHQRPSQMSTPRWNLEEALTQNNRGRRKALRSEVLKKLEEATEEVKLSQQALEEALIRVDIANKKQIEAGEALRRWIPKHRDNPNNPYLANPMFPLVHHVKSPATDIVRTNIDDDEPKPVLRTTVSMRDMLGRKLVLPEEYLARRQTEGRRVALSQMLNELREDLTFPPKSNRAGQDQRKQFLAQRKKFGFMHITLPLTKQSKKNVHASDLR